MTRIILIILSAIALAGCANLSGGGTPGKFIHEALPEDATIWAQEYDKHADRRGKMVPGTEAETEHELIDVRYTAPVPCSDIKGVDYYVGGQADGELELVLVGQQYGGKYIPPAANGDYWIRPALWVDRDYHSNKTGDFTTEQAQHLADHCGVKLQMRK